MKIYEKRAIRTYDGLAEDFDNYLEGRFTLPFNRLLSEIVQVPEGGRLIDINSNLDIPPAFFARVL